MKTVILAGGLGTRLSEETILKPKPMIVIGGKPIIWHIMQIYSFYNLNEFIICCGYKSHVIKEYFDRYCGDNTNKKLKNNNLEYFIKDDQNKRIKVTLAYTGKTTMTGGRLKRVRNLLKNDEIFCFTYGDGVSDINISNLINFHKKHKKLATISACRPQARYGALTFGNNDIVTNFVEKPEGDGSWINGGFFVLHPNVIEKIKDDQTSWEAEPLRNLAKENQLYAYKHHGFWMPMDTLRDKNELNKLWNEGNAPWKNWK
jgi:glucose-1-phosphate cytidylyltransferase